MRLTLARKREPRSAMDVHDNSIVLPVSPLPEQRLRSSRLARSLVVSLTLHLGVGWLLSQGYAEYLPRHAAPAILTVILTSKDEADSRPVAPENPFSQAESAAGTDAPSDAAGKLTQKARFLVAPDLAALEEIPVAFSGSVSFRLEVSASGTVDHATVLRSDPIPKDLLEGLISSFEQARLSPALAGSKPVASTLDVVIRYETSPTQLPQYP